MTRATPFQSYQRHVDFYRATYPDSITATRPAGRTGATMAIADQPSGDWSATATDDLIFAQLAMGTIRQAVVDFGAGRFGNRGARLKDFVVVPPRTDTVVILDGDHVLKMLCIPYAALLRLAGDDAGLPGDGDFGRVHGRMHADRATTRLLDQIWTESASGSMRGALWVDGALLQLAANLSEERPSTPAKGALADWQLKRVLDYVTADLARDVDIASLAALVGLSPSHFARAFKAATGLPPYRWLAERRIERARLLLADPQLSLTDVAQSVGYSGQGPFAEAFARIVGISPGGYRRRL